MNWWRHPQLVRPRNLTTCGGGDQLASATFLESQKAHHLDTYAEYRDYEIPHIK